MDIKKRIAELVKERDAGIERINKLNSELQSIQQTILRIDGALMILSEFEKEAEKKPQ
jgi:predicted nuclease with TOPRIM domain